MLAATVTQCPMALPALQSVFNRAVDEVQLTPQELVNFLGGGDGSVFGANRRARGRRHFTIRRFGEHLTKRGGGGALAISWPRDDFS